MYHSTAATISFLASVLAISGRAYDWSAPVPGFECTHSVEQGKDSCTDIPTSSRLPGVWEQSADATGPSTALGLLAAVGDANIRYNVS